MSVIQKNISNFIETQFPEIYRDEGPVFVEFVKQYYEWMENANANGAAIYHSRRILDYKDVDDTVDQFVLYFKEKYLKEIQLDTVAQTRNLIKNSLDLYRAKGTERAIDLFFRAVFGRPAEVYYPGEDVFRLSDGKWVKPKYLEVTPSEYNKIFVGQQIAGISSGATAFVERYIKRKVKNKYMHILYISSVAGEFETGEILTLDGQNLKNVPTVIGSLTTLDVLAGGAGFKIGEIVNVESDGGLQGKARVADISNITGLVEFKLIDSGWGYTTNAEVLISESVFFLEDVIPVINTSNKQAFVTFEVLKQPQANIVYKNANATISFLNGDNVYTYYSNNSQAGKGVVIAAANTSTTNGEIYIIELEGKLSPVQQPAANSTGTVAVTTAIGSLTGYASINTTSANLNGTGTLFTSQLNTNSVIRILAYNSNNQLLGIDTKKVVSISSDTVATVDSNLSFVSANSIIQYLGIRSIEGTGTSFDTDFVYGDKIAIYSNSSNYVIRTVNAISNATFMTIQEDMTFENTAANYAEVITNNYIYTSSNTVKANIHSYSDKTATANVIGSSSNVTLYLNNTNGTFVKSQKVSQRNVTNNEVAVGTISLISGVVGSNAVLYIDDIRGVFQPDNNFTLYSSYANGLITANGYVKKIEMTAGVIDINNTFLTDYDVIGNTSLTTANLKRKSSGAFATFEISDTLQYGETLNLFTSDSLEQYQYLALNAFSYGFPKYPSANGSTQYLEDILTQTQVTIGGVGSLIGLNPGKNYDSPPYITIYEPDVAAFNKADYTLDLSNVSSSFTIGEIVSQPGTAAIGVVKSANLTNMIIKRIQFENQFDTSNGLIGTSSGATANILSISMLDNAIQIGLNAKVTANVQTAGGSVTKLDVVDSGFGFIEGETADFISSDGERAGIAKVHLGKKGVSEGFYRNRNGFISDSKKIYDGEYYQDYSYEVRTSVTADKYSEMLKRVLHVAGTKSFSSIVLSGTTNVSTNIKTDITEE